MDAFNDFSRCGIKMRYYYLVGSDRNLIEMHNNDEND